MTGPPPPRRSPEADRSDLAVLRPMRWWDVDGLPAIERSLFGPDAWTAEQFWSELAGVAGSRWYAVVVEPSPQGEEVIGYTGLAVTGSSGQWSGDIQTMAVRADRQGRGLGRRLLDALLAEADRRGCAEVFLEVRPDRAAARALYAANGFVEIAVRPRYYADGSDALILRRGRPA